MKKVILVDSNSLLYRSYYALPNLSTKDGFPTGGIYGFLRIVSKLLTEAHSHFIIVGDAKGVLARSLVFKEYKTNRPKAPDELSLQRERLPDILGALSLPYIVYEGKEADDTISALTHFFERWGFQVEIYTSDTDMMQLISQNTTVVTFKKGITQVKRYDYSTFVEEFGFTPERFVDYKSLVGDSADNIPGVNGIGPKTATSLIKDFSREELLSKFGTVLERNLQLITLEDFPIPYSVLLLRVKPSAELKVLEEFEFNSLITPFLKVLGIRKVQVSLFGLEDIDRLPWQCLSDPTAVEEPFPFAFVKGEDPIRSANMLYAQRFLKRNDLGESPIKVFLDGEVRDIAVDEVLALLNAATNVSLEGDLLRLEQ